MKEIVVDYNKDKDRFELTVPFMMNGVAQSLPSRRWNKLSRKWFVPRVRKNVEYINMNIARMSTARVTEAAAKAIQETLVKKNVIHTEALPSWYKPILPFRSYQKTCCDQFYAMDCGALFQTMGVGKTKTAIDLVSARAMTPGKLNLDSVLVFCPFSIRQNWVKQIKEHCPIGNVTEVLSFNTKAGRKAFNDLERTSDKLRILIIGIESMSTGKAAEYAKFFMLSGKCAVIVDECSTIKNPRAKRTKGITYIGLQAAYKLILTGTPVTQGMMDLYSQFQFLDSDIIGVGDFYSFRNTYAVMGGYDNKEVIGYKNVEELLESIRPYVNQVGEEALAELPPKTFTTRTVDMTPGQKRAYKTLKDDFVIGEGVGAMRVQSALEKLMRLQQITGGFGTVKEVNLLTEKTEYKAVPLSDAKAQEVVAIAGETDASIVIWCRFTAEIRLVATSLRKAFGQDSAVEFYGAVSADERWKAVEKFQKKAARFFVGNPTVGGMGLDLYQGSVAIFYSNSFSYTDRVQAEARIHRIGQVNPCLYIDLVAPGTVDAHVLRAIKDKGTMAAFVRDALNDGRDPLELTRL